MNSKSSKEKTQNKTKVKKKGESTATKKKSNQSKNNKNSKYRKRSKNSKRNKRSRRKGRNRKDQGFDVKIVEVRRISKVNAGGRTMRLSVMVVIGDKRGKVGIGLAKAKSVRDAKDKAVNRAKKKMIKVPMKGQTIPHEITQKYGAAKVFLKPASPGTGVICGGAVRAVVEAAGIKDILSKIYGTNNIITNVYATYEALKNLRI